MPVYSTGTGKEGFEVRKCCFRRKDLGSLLEQRKLIFDYALTTRCFAQFTLSETLGMTKQRSVILNSVQNLKKRYLKEFSMNTRILRGVYYCTGIESARDKLLGIEGSRVTMRLEVFVLE